MNKINETKKRDIEALNEVRNILKSCIKNIRMFSFFHFNKPCPTNLFCSF